MRIISPPPGFDHRTVQPVANRFIDWATRPTARQVTDENIANADCVLVTKVTHLHTLTAYNSYCYSTATMVGRTLLTVTVCVHCLSCLQHRHTEEISGKELAKLASECFELTYAFFLALCSHLWTPSYRYLGTVVFFINTMPCLSASSAPIQSLAVFLVWDRADVSSLFWNMLSRLFLVAEASTSIKTIFGLTLSWFDISAHVCYFRTTSHRHTEGKHDRLWF